MIASAERHEHLRPAALVAGSGRPSVRQYATVRGERVVDPVRRRPRGSGWSGSVASSTKSTVSPARERELGDGGAVLDLERHASCAAAAPCRRLRASGRRPRPVAPRRRARRARSRSAARSAPGSVSGPRAHVSRRTIACAWRTSPTGMKSVTSPTPSSHRNRVSRTFVSGQVHLAQPVGRGLRARSRSARRCASSRSAANTVGESKCGKHR